MPDAAPLAVQEKGTIIMRKSVVSGILAVLCLAIVGLVAVGCGCGSDEFDPEDTCQKVTAALNRAITRCNQTTLLTSDEVCGGRADTGRFIAPAASTWTRAWPPSTR
jgi:hypothetical protein